MSTIAAIGDAVAAHINAGTFSQPVVAERTYQPAFTLEDLKDLRVSIVPRTVGISAASRDSSIYECVVDVGVQKKLLRRSRPRSTACWTSSRRSPTTCGSRASRTRPRPRGRESRTSRWCRASRWSSTGCSRAS